MRPGSRSRQTGPGWHVISGKSFLHSELGSKRPLSSGLAPLSDLVCHHPWPPCHSSTAAACSHWKGLPTAGCFTFQGLAQMSPLGGGLPDSPTLMIHFPVLLTLQPLSSSGVFLLTHLPVYLWLSHPSRASSVICTVDSWCLAHGRHSVNIS